MSVWDDFKKFALKGNMIDLAVGVIIGAAFGKVVGSLVDNILTPPLGLVIGGVDFTHLRLVLKAASEGSAEVSVGYGIFLQAILNFSIVAAALFVLIKLLSHLQRTQPPPPPSATPEDILLLREIRDNLKK